ncbi:MULTISPECIES: tyrosinase family protein [Priestia]|uniref:tyrosinase family protein n=1 Tax=Priestia TaxID=2800373 RepID=UPI00196AE919|nr:MULTISPECIES: tyrosinase family protein [Priestia]MDC7765253.1 tyrosinase family protein [Priestia aryabhattai]MED3820157.1 tyrosinase family protein [Priestia aryabhattai]QSF35180.1 tyrosinase family protein [Priestia megaterium]WJN43223.1 tyrosinase family protein [Priestia aryabhattai]
MSNKYKVRKNVLHLTDTEKRDFIRAVLILKEKGIYDRYVAWHGAAGKFHTPPGSDRNAAHMSSAFLPWHREYLLRFERDLQSINPEVTLPYWEWETDAQLQDPSQSAIWNADFMGGNGNPKKDFIVDTGPFAAGRWTTIDEQGNPSGGLKRNLGATKEAPTLPTRDDVLKALKITQYDTPPWDMTSQNSFRNQLEGFINGPQLHNRVHRWVGGQMGIVPTAPNDPVFFLHHANVDRIWAVWQIVHRNQNYLPMKNGPFGQNFRDPMYPWNTTPEDVMNHRKLGYVYDIELRKSKRSS